MHNDLVTKYIHVMKYMGSKRELLGQLEKIVTSNLANGNIVLDIFSGTCGVGIYLRDSYPIYSNDIQLYSKIISQGTIEAAPLTITSDHLWPLLKDKYNENYEFLSDKLAAYIHDSQYFINIDSWTDRHLADYSKFIQTVPYPNNHNGMRQEGRWLIDQYFARGHNNHSFPYFQTVSLFSEMYFSIEQAISIDSIKYAIDNMGKEYKSLAALLNVARIHAFSYSSAGTGHFAQFRDLSTLSSVTDVFLYRSRSVKDYFFRKAEEMLDATKRNRYHEDSRSFALDYRDLLREKQIMRNVKLVYADPPYSFVHYSMFYHAIENLCRYDYPIVGHKGRYRTDRHQSPFCIKTQTAGAFRSLLHDSHEYNVPVLLSYSNTGMIKIERVIEIAKEIGYKTDLIEIAHKHSTMGRLRDKDRDVMEAPLLCY